MESQGKMLVALSVIAVLTGFSAIGYVAVQKNANVVSRAQTSPSTNGSTPNSGTTGGAPSCTSPQDCIDFAIAKGMCNAGAACPPSGSRIDCTAGVCVLTPGQAGSPDTRSPERRTCSTGSMGDFDCNGAINCADLMVFVSEFTGRVTTKSSDITSDGKVSLIDFEMGRRASNGAWASCLL